MHLSWFQQGDGARGAHTVHQKASSCLLPNLCQDSQITGASRDLTCKINCNNKILVDFTEGLHNSLFAVETLCLCIVFWVRRLQARKDLPISKIKFYNGRRRRALEQCVFLYLECSGRPPESCVFCHRWRVSARGCNARTLCPLLARCIDTRTEAGYGLNICRGHFPFGGESQVHRKHELKVLVAVKRKCFTWSKSDCSFPPYSLGNVLENKMMVFSDT